MAVLTRSPELMSRTLMLSDYLRFNSTLPPRLSEFVILMTAREWGRTTNGMLITRSRSKGD